MHHKLPQKNSSPRTSFLYVLYVCAKIIKERSANEEGSSLTNHTDCMHGCI